MTRLRSLSLLAAAIAVMGGLAQLSTATAVSTPRRCVVPNVEGKVLSAATQAIKRHHCRVGTIRRAFSETVAKGQVVSQAPHPGTLRPAGARVGLVVSKGASLPSAGAVVARISVANSPFGLLALPGAVWVTAHRGDSIFRIDTSSNTVVARVGVAEGDEQPGRMTFGDGTLFEENYSGEGVSLVDPARDTVTSVIHGPLENCCFPAYGAGSLWLLEVSSSSENEVVRLDPSGHVIMTMNLTNALGLTFAAGSVWGSSDGQVFRLDPAGNKIVAHVSTDAVPAAYGAGSVWGVSADGSKLIRIAPATNSVSATIGLPAAGNAVAATDSAVWVAEGSPDSAGSRLWKIDPATNQVVGQVKLAVTSVFADIAVSADGDVWLSTFDSGLVLRVRPSG